MQRVFSFLFVVLKKFYKAVDSRSSIWYFEIRKAQRRKTVMVYILFRNRTVGTRVPIPPTRKYSLKISR